MNETNLLKAGAAMIDITPPAGTHLAGSGAGEHRPAQAVMDPLFAKAIVFETNEQRVCMVILDLTIVTGSYTDQIRTAIGEQTGIAPEAIMVQATQTHSAPSLGYFMPGSRFPIGDHRRRPSTCAGPSAPTATGLLPPQSRPQSKR